MFNVTYRFIGQLSPLCLLSFLAAFNALLPSMLHSWFSQGPAQAISSGLGQNLTIWLALLSCGYLVIKQAPDNSLFPAKGIEQTLAVCLGLLLLIPNATSSWLIAALASVGWWKTSQPNSAARTSAILMLAIALRDPLSLLGLNLLTEQLLSFDRLVTQLILSFSLTAPEHSNIVIGEHFNLVILTGCSSFTNISLALLLWLNCTLLLHKNTHKKDLYRIALLIVLTLSCNSLRLSMMSLSMTDYAYFHEGGGAELFSYLTTFVALLCVNWSKSHEKYQHMAAKPQFAIVTSRSVGTH